MKVGLDVKLKINKGANEMVDKFETNKHFRRWMWAVIGCVTMIFIIKYLPALIIALK